ncbi:MAG: MBL fold metallo-hydrolase [Tissierellia bacterium]|nr:MBL fold metallo-hydrolase [Tissierellia bacterium]
MTIKFCALSSGSNGNCHYIESKGTRLLIDAGFSGKRIEELLSSIHVKANTIDYILITHEHIDHIKGAGILSRRYNIPIIANKNTWLGMADKIGEIKDKNIKVIQTNEDFNLGDLGIYPFNIYHDAAEPIGYIIYYKKVKISIATDTGWVDNSIKNKIKGSNLYLIESNHDVEMLKNGSYPWFLKQRVLSEEGHLSNIDAGEILSEILLGNGEIVLLGHLSKENNTPSLAYETVKEAVGEVYENIELDLSLRDRPTKLYTL